MKVAPLGAVYISQAFTPIELLEGAFTTRLIMIILFIRKIRIVSKNNPDVEYTAPLGAYGYAGNRSINYLSCCPLQG